MNQREAELHEREQRARDMLLKLKQFRMMQSHQLQWQSQSGISQQKAEAKSQQNKLLFNS
jgi:hypothetical protein